MTLVRLRGRIPGFGQLDPLASGIIAAERWRGDAPVALVRGQDYIPDTILRTSFVNGQPADPLDLEPTDNTFCIRWTITAIGPDHSGTALVRFTSIPAEGPIDFGDLRVVDPATYLPQEDVPASVRELLADATTAMHGAVTNAALALTERQLAEAARGGAEGARDIAVGAKSDLIGARDAAVSAAASADASAKTADNHRKSAGTSAYNAGASAASALGHANESDGSRELSADAASASSTAAAAAELSRAQALQLLQQMEALRNAPDGYLVLDPQGLIPASRLPLGSMSFQGVWDAAANSPALSNATGKRGQVYAVTVAGDRNLGSGTIDFLVGDQLVHDGTRWNKIDNTDQVLDVNGRRGSIVLVKADVGLGSVDNTPDAEKPVSSAQRTEFNKTVIAGSIVGNNLILTLAGGGQVDAGNVRGPQGVKGDPGDLTAVSYSGNTNLSAGAPMTRHFALSANLTLTLTPNPGSQVAFSQTLIIKQATSGGPFTVTFPVDVKWSGPANTPAPTMPTQAGAELIVHLFWTGAAWRGYFGGAFL